jgi:hypothetical protein
MEPAREDEWIKQIILGFDFTAYQVYWRGNTSLVASDFVIIEHNPRSSNISINVAVEVGEDITSRLLGNITVEITSPTEIDHVSIDYERHTWDRFHVGRGGTGGGSGGLFRSDIDTFTYPSPDLPPYFPRYNITDGFTYYLLTAYDRLGSYGVGQGTLIYSNPEIDYSPVGSYIPEGTNVLAIWLVLALPSLFSARKAKAGNNRFPKDARSNPDGLNLGGPA